MIYILIGRVKQVKLQTKYLDYRTIGVLTKLKQYLPSRILLAIYNTLIVPYLNYGIQHAGLCSNAFAFANASSNAAFALVLAFY